MKKQYSNLNADGTQKEAAAPKAKKKTTKKRASKPSSRKYAPRAQKANLDYSVPTFGPLIPRIEGVGFVYLVTATTQLGTRYYVGSKSFTKGKDWRTYCTSSPLVQKLIEYSRINPEVIQIKFEVLEQVTCSSWLRGREEAHMRRIYNLVGKDAMINVATPTGYSLRTGKNLGK